MSEWIETHEQILRWLIAASVVAFVGTLIAVPFLAARIPSDYFVHGRRDRKHWAGLRPAVRAVRVLCLIGKNLVGCVFVVAGAVLLVLPGQGVITILIGIMLLDFPGKYRLERWLVARPRVLRCINWLRRRAGRGPLVLEE